MITLNIISDQQRSVIKSIRRYQLLKRIGFSAIIVFILVSLLLGVSLFLLNQNLATINQQIADTEKKIQGSNQGEDIKESVIALNKKINLLKIVQSEYREMSMIIDPLTQAMPDGVTLTSFSINILNNTFEISGTSQNRQSLLDFQNQLANTEIFSEIKSPLSNLAEKENISFKLTGKLTI